MSTRIFLDNEDRAVIPTRTGDIWRLKEVNTAAGTQLVKDHTCTDGLPTLTPSGQEILSALPDAHGLLWFTASGNSSDASGEPAMVGTANPDPSNSSHCTVKLHTLPSGELIVKSFAVDPDPSRLAGTGILYKSYYSSVYLGPDGKTAYVGVLGGLVRIHENY